MRLSTRSARRITALSSWTPGRQVPVDEAAWDLSFRAHYSLVAVDGEKIVGFGDMDPAGYLDRLYVHRDYQRQGVATALCDALEKAVRGDVTVHASRTARPFFEKRGLPRGAAAGGGAAGRPHRELCHVAPRGGERRGIGAAHRFSPRANSSPGKRKTAGWRRKK